MHRHRHSNVVKHQGHGDAKMERRYKKSRAKPSLAGGLQIAKQSVERCSVAIVSFPPAKIADVPRAVDVSSPIRVMLHDGLVNSDGK